MACTINGQVMLYALSGFQQAGDHTVIEGHFNKPPGRISQISIFNTVLNSIPDQSNIVEIDLNNESRDYLMRVQRQRIVVDY